MARKRKYPEGTMCKVCGIKPVHGLGMCELCYGKDYKQKNKEKIKPVRQAQYLRTREKRLMYAKKWLKDHPEWKAEKDRRWKAKNAELRVIQDKTRHYFNHLKKEGKCEECDSKEKLEFHHLKPYAYDNFKILCMECHKESHNRLLVRTKPKLLFCGDK
jgi:5-methylcytosine-specific restriction endonuclease McrA